MDITTFINRLRVSPDTIEFNDTIAVIDTHYTFSPTAFKNADLENEAGKNSGSCKLFAFAQLHHLSPQETLYCFGNYYKEVLDTPEKTDHQNIRNFMKTGWGGIAFEGIPLVLISRC